MDGIGTLRCGKWESILAAKSIPFFDQKGTDVTFEGQKSYIFKKKAHIYGKKKGMFLKAIYSIKSTKKS